MLKRVYSVLISTYADAMDMLFDVNRFQVPCIDAVTGFPSGDLAAAYAWSSSAAGYLPSLSTARMPASRVASCCLTIECLFATRGMAEPFCIESRAEQVL